MVMRFFVRVRCPVPGPSRGPMAGNTSGVSVDGGFAAVMAQVRRPVPFRTRKLRPGAAMVLHSEGCGRVARRRIHSCLAGSPGGGPAFFRFPCLSSPGRFHGVPGSRHGPRTGVASAAPWHRLPAKRGGSGMRLSPCAKTSETLIATAEYTEQLCIISYQSAAPSRTRSCIKTRRRPSRQPIKAGVSGVRNYGYIAANSAANGI